MADLKISQLSDGGASQATDEYVVARSGANYRIDGASVAAAATSVGTLSSLTISGDLTVDTSTLKVDSANNRVGIGTTSPSGVFDIRGSGTSGDNNVFLRWAADSAGYSPGLNLYKARGTITSPTVVSSGDQTGVLLFGGYDGSGYQATAYIESRVDGTPGSGDMPGRLGFFTTADGSSSPTEKMRIDSSGNLAVDTNTLYVDATNNRVGVGTATPSTVFEINGAGANANPTLLITRSANGSTCSLAFGDGTNNNRFTLASQSAFTISSGTTPTTHLTLDTGGNLGLGVTPSAWASGFRAVQVGNGAAFWGLNDVRYAYMSANVYYDGATKYLGTGAATWYIQELGAHKWQTAASGTAGNAITFTQAMTLDASGNLLVGPTTAGFNGLNVTRSGAACYLNIYGGTSSSEGGILIGGNNVENRANIIYKPATDVFQISCNTSGGVTAFLTNNTERARITSGGDFCVNATSGNGKITVEVPDGTTNAFYAARTGGSPATLDLDFANAYVNWNASVRYQIVSGGSGGVYLDSTATSWTAVSDERFKTDLTPIADAVTKVNTLRAVTGRYITDDEAKSRAFLIAQDVQAVLPEAVSDSDPDCLGLSYTDVVPLLVAAIKELTARLEALEA